MHIALCHSKPFWQALMVELKVTLSGTSADEDMSHISVSTRIAVSHSQHFLGLGLIGSRISGLGFRVPKS